MFGSLHADAMFMWRCRYCAVRVELHISRKHINTHELIIHWRMLSQADSHTHCSWHGNFKHRSEMLGLFSRICLDGCLNIVLWQLLVRLPSPHPFDVVVRTIRFNQLVLQDAPLPICD